jgi:hypothetical protein
MAREISKQAYRTTKVVIALLKLKGIHFNTHDQMVMEDVVRISLEETSAPIEVQGPSRCDTCGRPLNECDALVKDIGCSQPESNCTQDESKE